MYDTAGGKGFLDGVGILDLAVKEGCFCTRTLADLGARVIKVEKPRIDPADRDHLSAENLAGEKDLLRRGYFDAGKRSITLDLESGNGRDVVALLVRRSDVVVEDFGPGYLDSFSLGFEDLRGINPGIILASISPFGKTGPHSDYRSCGLATEASGGQVYVGGLLASKPLGIYGGQSHYTASLFGAISILLALRRRRLTGKGSHIDISAQEAVASTLDHVLVRYFADGIIGRRQGSLSWNHTAFIVPCKDGHVHLNIATQWATLVEWMDSEGMAGDLTEVEWSDETYRFEHVDHIMELLGKWAGCHSRDELFELGQAMRFPWAPVLSPLEVLESPQLRERGFFFESSLGKSRKRVLYPGAPYRYDGSGMDTTRRAPMSGENNEEIYCGELGMSRDEMKRLSSIKVI